MKKFIILVMALATSVGFAKTLEEHLEAYKIELAKGWNAAFQYVVDNKTELEPEFIKWEKAAFDINAFDLNSMMLKFYDIDSREGKKLNPPIDHLIGVPNLLVLYHPEKVPEVLNSDKYELWIRIRIAVYTNSESWLNSLDQEVAISYDKYISWKLKKLILSNDVKSAYNEATKIDNIITSKLVDKPDSVYLQNTLKKVQNIEDQLYIKLSRQNKL